MGKLNLNLTEVGQFKKPLEAVTYTRSKTQEITQQNTHDLQMKDKIPSRDLRTSAHAFNSEIGYGGGLPRWGYTFALSVISGTACHQASPVKLNNGAFMPSIALGTWKSKKGEVGKAVKLALHYGYRHVDCAEAYQNEDEIGDTLTDVFKEGKIKREDVFITSKLWSNSHAPEDVLPACQTTLKNLQLDYLDLYLIHLPIAFKKDARYPHSKAEGTIGYSPEGIAQTWQAMEKLVEQGLCKAIGISNFTIKKTNTLLENAKIIPACNQVELHPYLHQPELLEFSTRKGIVLTAYSPLGSPDRPFVGKDEPIVLDNPLLRKIADKHKTTIALVALAWGIKRGTPVLPKAVSENHIKENLEALNVKLGDDDMKAIENIGIRHRYFTMRWMFKPEEVPHNYWDGEE